MASISPILTLSLLFFSLIPSSHSLACTSQKFTNNKKFDRCNDLPQLNSYLHWSLDNSKSSLSIAFVAPPAKPDGWISWAINPTGTGMLGSQALIAFREPGGSMTVKTYNLSSYSSIVEGKLGFDVMGASAEYENGLMKIFATVKLPVKNMTTVNQVWQVGPAVVNGFPARHDFGAANLNARGTLDLLSGQSTGGDGGDSRTKLRNIHGILNGVGWGILLPSGVIMARYMRIFPSLDPAWFYLHVTCQCSAFALGVAGFITGLTLGRQTKGVEHTSHRNLGITLFCLATLQVFALFVRPGKDHKLRIYWKFYHQGAGYAIVALGILNVFKGLDILDPAGKWKRAYMIVIAALGLITVLLELITWIVVIKRKKSSNTTKPTKQPLPV